MTPSRPESRHQHRWWDTTSSRSSMNDTTKGDKMSQTAVQLLEGGLDYIRTYGWRQGSFGYKNPGDTCPACPVGALRAAAGFREGMPATEIPEEYYQAREALDSSIPELIDGDGFHVQHTPVYNDEFAGSQEEIEQFYLRAIEYAREEFDELISQ